MASLKNPRGWFATTHWSVILTARDLASPQASQALEALCRTYWYPLYVFLRREGCPPPDAQDLTQAFFARLLEKDYLGRADRARGKFRSFLLTSLKHFLADVRDRARALKRGGNVTFLSLDVLRGEERYGLEPAETRTPEQFYDQRWAYTILDQATQRLSQECAAAGKATLYEQITAFLADGQETYAQAAARLGLPENSLKSMVRRLHQRKRELIRQVIADTVADPREVNEELRCLIEVLRE